MARVIFWSASESCLQTSGPDFGQGGFDSLYLFGAALFCNRWVERMRRSQKTGVNRYRW